MAIFHGARVFRLSWQKLALRRENANAPPFKMLFYIFCIHVLIVVHIYATFTPENNKTRGLSHPSDRACRVTRFDKNQKRIFSKVNPSFCFLTNHLLIAQCKTNKSIQQMSEDEM